MNHNIPNVEIINSLNYLVCFFNGDHRYATGVSLAEPFVDLFHKEECRSPLFLHIAAPVLQKESFVHLHPEMR